MATNAKLPAEKEQQSPKRWQCGDPPEYQHLKKHDGKPLEKVYKWMKDYDKEMCDAWRDEIEKLLIFAGLFAATVTPFAVESYKWLQEDNAAASTKLLGQISLQLAAIANNSTSPTISLPDSSLFIPLERSVRINAVWFLSLIMCLSTVILGVLCLAWLREYSREFSLASFDAITVRQIRYEGLLHWKVPELVSLLPIALQISVLLFFGGILDLLWSLHPAVAAVTTTAVGIVAVALVFTTIAPVVQCAFYFHRPSIYAAMKQCPYKSPFSLLFLRLALFVDRHSFRITGDFLNGRSKSWDEFDVAWDAEQSLVQEGKDFYNARGLAKALAWTIKKLAPAGAQSDIIPEIFYSLHSSLPKLVSHKTLQSWATSTDDKDHNVMVALSLNEHDLSESQVQYDLLMAWFLQAHSLIFNCDDLLMELRLRCLNTLIDRRQMNEMFDDMLEDYVFSITTSNKKDASAGELRFQIMATILEYHSRDARAILNNAYFVGCTLAEYIRCTPVKPDNALKCYEIYKWFEGLLEDIRSSAEKGLCEEAHSSGEHRFTVVNDHDASIHRQSLTAALLFGRLDLRELEAWEKNITEITGKRISMSGQLISFLEQCVLPALEAQDAFLTVQVRCQLGAYHNMDPLLDCAVTETGEVPIT